MALLVPRSGHLIIAMGSVVACGTCGLEQHAEEVRPGTKVACGRCGSIVGKRRVDGLDRTAAFSPAALIPYVPVDVYPIRF